eukprot:13557036-Alexandrium_andersonii.AAC.1
MAVGSKFYHKRYQEFGRYVVAVQDLQPIIARLKQQLQSEDGFSAALREGIQRLPTVQDRCRLAGVAAFELMLTAAAIDKIHSLTALAERAFLAGETFQAAEDPSM